jgi:hypothetical protein
LSVAYQIITSLQWQLWQYFVYARALPLFLQLGRCTQMPDDAICMFYDSDVTTTTALLDTVMNLYCMFSDNDAMIITYVSIGSWLLNWGFARWRLSRDIAIAPCAQETKPLSFFSFISSRYPFNQFLQYLFFIFQ